MTIDKLLLNTFRDYVLRFPEPVVSFAEAIGWEMSPRTLAPRTLPVVHCLQRCLKSVDAGRPLAALLSANAGRLCWSQTYDASDFGTDFLERYGWIELFGTRGHFVNDEIAGGFLLLGPNVTYPDHHHLAEEIYVPLTGGAEWRMGEGAYRPRKADEIIHHPSNIVHAMRTGAKPLLALYLWRGGPLAQKSIIVGKDRFQKA